MVVREDESVLGNEETGTHATRHGLLLGLTATIAARSLGRLLWSPPTLEVGTEEPAKHFIRILPTTWRIAPTHLGGGADVDNGMLSLLNDLGKVRQAGCSSALSLRNGLPTCQQRCKPKHTSHHDCAHAFGIRIKVGRIQNSHMDSVSDARTQKVQRTPWDGTYWIDWVNRERVSAGTSPITVNQKFPTLAPWRLTAPCRAAP